jgi:hypothetical protein
MDRDPLVACLDRWGRDRVSRRVCLDRGCLSWARPDLREPRASNRPRPPGPTPSWRRAYDDRENKDLSAKYHNFLLVFGGFMIKVAPVIDGAWIDMAIPVAPRGEGTGDERRESRGERSRGWLDRRWLGCKLNCKIYGLCIFVARPLPDGAFTASRVLSAH